MSIKCFLTGTELTGDVHEYEVGAMWWGNFPHYPQDPPEMAKETRALWVILPNNAGAFCLQMRSHSLVNGQGLDGERWTVTGTPPNMTLTPSINVVGIWHGFLTNGELVG